MLLTTVSDNTGSSAANGLFTKLFFGGDPFKSLRLHYYQARRVGGFEGFERTP